MQKVETTCDNCSKDLSDAGSMPAYRLCLSSQKIANSGMYMNAVHVTPMLVRDHHFCGVHCLLEWTGRTYPAALMRKKSEDALTRQNRLQADEIGDD